MFYIHNTTCISPQITFPEVDLDQLISCTENKFYTKEIPSTDIPPAILRRMGRAVKLGVVASIPLLKLQAQLNGIIIGSANGGMEDCIKFLNQIIDYEEGVLTPTNFVQSTSNAIASQLGFISKNQGYNITHVHRGLAFENAVLDVAMLLQENPKHTYLLGGIDEIADYNFNIEYLCGYIKKNSSNLDLYNSKTSGSIAGEGAAMFVINNKHEGAVSELKALKTIHTTNEKELVNVFEKFINDNLPENKTIDLFLSGENGDIRYEQYYKTIESVMNSNVSIAHYKHLSGEFQTASAFALWVSNYIIQTQKLPLNMLKKQTVKKNINTILLYNNYQGYQHSFMLLEKA